MRWITLLVCSAALVWEAGAGERPVPLHPGDEPAQGTESPPPGWSGFQERDLDGRRWTSEDLLGRVVVLEWWASWCLPCREQIPALQRLRAEFPIDQLVLLGVLVDRASSSRVRAAVGAFGVEWPQLHQQAGFGGDLSRRFGIEAVPRTLLFDREGRLVAKDLRGERLRAAVVGLLELDQGAELNPQRLLSR